MNKWIIYFCRSYKLCVFILLLIHCLPKVQYIYLVTVCFSSLLFNIDGKNLWFAFVFYHINLILILFFILIFQFKYLSDTGISVRLNLSILLHSYIFIMLRHVYLSATCALVRFTIRYTITLRGEDIRLTLEIYSRWLGVYLGDGFDTTIWQKSSFTKKISQDLQKRYC